MNLTNLQEKVVRIADKYADLVEQRIDGAESLTGQDLRDVYDSIQMLGHITATLERFNKMKDINV